MRRLVKTIRGYSCEVYVIAHHNRKLLGTAEPEIEIYEDVTSLKSLGTSTIQHKRTCFSIVICPNPEMDMMLSDDFLKGITAFDLKLEIPRKRDGVFVPITLWGICSAELTDDRWIFEITDAEAIRNLLAI